MLDIPGVYPRYTTIYSLEVHIAIDLMDKNHCTT